MPMHKNDAILRKDSSVDEIDYKIEKTEHSRQLLVGIAYPRVHRLDTSFTKLTGRPEY